MKRKLFAFLILFVSCSTSGNENPSSSVATLPDPGKTLIVYLSRTSNTKTVAEIIHAKTGGTLLPLELEKPYPENYQAIVNQVAAENASGFLPPLKTTVSIEKYDVIFLGFPTWGMQLPPPMKSFLSKYDLKGKTIVPFNTNAGYGLGTTIETIRALCPNSRILEAYSTTGGIERDGIKFVMTGDKRKATEKAVSAWLNRIKLN